MIDTTALGPQPLRVYRALQRAGEHGITSADFAGDTAIDGGPRILRVPRVIADLRDSGAVIPEPSKLAEHRRDQCVVFRFVPDVLAALRESPEPSMYERVPDPIPGVAITFDIRSDEARRALAAALDYHDQHMEAA